MCTDSVLPSHSLLEIVEMAWGRGSPPSPGREPGAGWRELGAACNVVWGPEKLGGSAGRLSRSADPAVGVGGRRGAPRDGPGGAGASWKEPKQCVLTGVPRKQWPGPSTRAERRERLQGPGEGPGLAVDPDAHPSEVPGRPKILVRESRSSAHL